MKSTFSQAGESNSPARNPVCNAAISAYRASIVVVSRDVVAHYNEKALGIIQLDRAFFPGHWGQRGPDKNA
jgi:hypothetical protein